jgi:hypothetical protein
MNTYVQQAPATAPPGWHPDPQAPGGVARRGAGLTQLPTPKVDADVYSSGISGGELSDRPGQIILTDHSLLENISWSSYGGGGLGSLGDAVRADPLPAFLRRRGRRPRLGDGQGLAAELHP